MEIEIAKPFEYLFKSWILTTVRGFSYEKLSSCNIQWSRVTGIAVVHVVIQGQARLQHWTSTVSLDINIQSLDRGKRREEEHCTWCFYDLESEEPLCQQ